MIIKTFNLKVHNNLISMLKKIYITSYKILILHKWYKPLSLNIYVFMFLLYIVVPARNFKEEIFFREPIQNKN